MKSSSDSRPLVTVGIPAYNSEKYIAQSIESLLAQTYSDFVMVICDNDSTDGTADICLHYVQMDSRVHYYKNPTNIGMTGNFNRVFELTNTKYIKWSTADDYWAPEMLGDAVSVMESDDSIVVCYPRAIIVDAEGVEQAQFDDNLHLMQSDPAERFLAYLSNVRLVNHHLGLLRTDAVRRTRLFGKHIAADTGFLAELSLYGKFYNIPKYQFYRRFHVDSSSWNRGDEEHEARRFYAANVRKTPFNAWRFHWAYIGGVLRAPISVSKKIKLVRHLSHQMYWDRGALCSDLLRSKN